MVSLLNRFSVNHDRERLWNLQPKTDVNSMIEVEQGRGKVVLWCKIVNVSMYYCTIVLDIWSIVDSSLNMLHAVVERPRGRLGDRLPWNGAVGLRAPRRDQWCAWIDEMRW